MLNVPASGDVNYGGVLVMTLPASASGSDATAYAANVASIAHGLGAALVGVEDADGNFAAATVEAALAELAEGRFSVAGTFAKGSSAAGATLVNGVAAKQIFVEGFAVEVNGATAWTDSLTYLQLADDNGSALVAARMNTAALTANALIIPGTANTNIGTGFTRGLTAAKNLVLKGDAVANNGSTLNYRVWGRIK